MRVLFELRDRLDGLTPNLSTGLLILLLITVSFFVNLGGWPLFDVDEGAFSAATKHLVDSGDYVTPYLYGEPRFDKPILIYWLQGISISAFGFNEFALRLPSALSLSLWGIALFYFLLGTTNIKVSLFALLILTTNVACIGISRFASADGLLNLFIALSFFDMYRYWEARNKRVVYRVFLWISLGVLTKGPIAILVPLVSGFVFFSLQKDLKLFLRAVFDPIGWVVLLLLVTPWYAAILLDQGQAFIDGFLLKHNIGRFAETLEGHGGSIFYYVPIIFLLLLPFSGLLVPLFSRFSLKTMSSLDQYCYVTFGFVFIFFSLSSTQLPHYLLYGFTPLIILLAKQQRSFESKFLILLPTFFACGLFLCLPEIASMASEQVTAKDQQMMLASLKDEIDAVYWFSLATLFCTLAWMSSRWVQIEQCFYLAAIAQSIFLVLVFIPTIAQVAQSHVKEAAQFANARDQEIVMWKAHIPSFSAYSIRPVERRSPDLDDLVLTRIQHLDSLPNAQVIFSKKGLVLAEIVEASSD